MSITPQVSPDGLSWRSGSQAEEKEVAQYRVQINKLAESLASGLKNLENWPSHVISLQQNHIASRTQCLIKCGLESAAAYQELFPFNDALFQEQLNYYVCLLSNSTRLFHILWLVLFRFLVFLLPPPPRLPLPVGSIMPVTAPFPGRTALRTLKWWRQDPKLQPLPLMSLFVGFQGSTTKVDV